MIPFYNSKYRALADATGFSRGSVRLARSLAVLTMSVALAGPIACSDVDSQDPDSTSTSTSTSTATSTSTQSSDGDSSSLSTSTTTESQSSASDSSQGDTAFTLLIIDEPLELCGLRTGNMKWGVLGRWIENFVPAEGRYSLAPGTYDLAAGIGPRMVYTFPDGREIVFDATTLQTYGPDPAGDAAFSHRMSISVQGQKDGLIGSVVLDLAMLKGDSQYRVAHSFPHQPLREALIASFRAGGHIRDAAVDSGSTDPALFDEFQPYMGTCVWDNVPDDLVRFDLPDGDFVQWRVHVDWDQYEMPTNYTQVYEVTGKWRGVDIHESRFEYLSGGLQTAPTDFIANPFAPMWWTMRFEEPVGSACGLMVEIGYGADGRYNSWLGSIGCAGDKDEFEELSSGTALPKRLSASPW